MRIRRFIAVLAIGLWGVGCSGQSTGSPAGPTPPSPTATAPAPTAPPPTAAPPSASPGLETLATEGDLFPGRYRTQFDPAMTITVTDLVDLDCAPGYRCRGDINVNIDRWLDLEFGNVHGSELMIFRIDKVFVDEAAGTVEDPPADFASRIAHLPGVKQLSAPVAVTVGGMAGTRLDLNPTHDVTIGASGLDDLAGFGIAGDPDKRAWITTVNVNGRWVAIMEVLGPENTVADFDAVVAGLQPIVDSITWE